MKPAPAATMGQLSSTSSAGRFIQSRQKGISDRRAWLLCDTKVGVIGKIDCLTTNDVLRQQPQILGLRLWSIRHSLEADRQWAPSLWPCRPSPAAGSPRIYALQLPERRHRKGSTFAFPGCSPIAVRKRRTAWRNLHLQVGSEWRTWTPGPAFPAQRLSSAQSSLPWSLCNLERSVSSQRHSSCGWICSAGVERSPDEQPQRASRRVPWCESGVRKPNQGPRVGWWCRWLPRLCTWSCRLEKR